MDESRALRVVIVDDSEVVRQEMRQVLASGGFEVTGEAADGASGVEIAARERPDVVVMDLQMPGMTGIEATWKLGSIAPEIGVLVLTVSDDTDDVADAVMAGAKGYVLKGSTEEEIVAAVRSVAAGQSVISPAVAWALVRRSAGTLEPAAQDVADRAALRADPSETGTRTGTGTLKDDALATAKDVPTAPMSPAGRLAPWTLAAVLAAGIALSAVNEGSTIVDGDASLATWGKVAFNFVFALAVWVLALNRANRHSP